MKDNGREKLGLNSVLILNLQRKPVGWYILRGHINISGFVIHGWKGRKAEKYKRWQKHKVLRYKIILLCMGE